MRTSTIIAMFAAAAVSGPVAAKEKPPVFVETRPVKDKPAVTLDVTKAFVLLRSDSATPLYLMKVPSAEDQASYDKVRAAAFAEAREKYAKKLASYERDLAAAQRTKGLSVPKKPVEPTEANFEFTSFELMASAGIGPFNRFAKASGGLSTYLQEITPGIYRIYGLLSATPGVAAMGTCFCMGSIKFEAKAGEIVDLGTIEAQPKIERPKGDAAAPVDLTGQKLFQPGATPNPVDPRLAAYKMVPATFSPAGKLPNYFGLPISRLPAIPGVMRYDRDRIIDLTGDQ